uniref:Helitron helicase-like domain-containing protein n=1 Tax=Aegilops tauschii subsp. strangulata TaxID=200361 RepID=A0A452XX52_AEGTS
ILEQNPYAQAFKSLGSVPNLDEYKISLNTDIKLDQRRYNAPTTSQVAAIWVEGSDPQNCFDRSVVGLVDTIVAGESRGDRIGKRIVLPRTFPGGDRDMQRRLLDAMAIVQRWGKPDYFITMTCNPYWERR